MAHWLMKSEPGTFSIFDLEKAPKQTTSWNGVRNYQARNFMRDQFKKGDEVFFYHSSSDPTGIFGVCKVVREGYPDASDEDQKSTWYMVDIKLEKIFKTPVTLEQIRANGKLQKMLLVQKGSRLSIQPVTPAEWAEILKMSKS
jgi:predicted RNA-binding protein with PUA-like domain